MRYSSGALCGLGAAAVLGMLVAALEVSVAAIPAARGVDPASVNRTLKGDRVPASPAPDRASPGQRTTDPKLPDGCVAEADWHNNVYSDEIAGRCVA